MVPLPLDHDDPVRDPPLAVAPLEPIHVPAAVEQQLPGLVAAEDAQPVALGVRLVAVDLHGEVGDVALVARKRAMGGSEERDQPVEVADVPAVVLDRIRVVGGAEQLLVIAIDAAGVAGTQSTIACTIEQPAQGVELRIAQTLYRSNSGSSSRSFQQVAAAPMDRPCPGR